MRASRTRHRFTAALAGALAVSAVAVTDAGAVSGDSTITTVAGVGSGGFNGDGLPGTSTRVNNPQGLAFGADGTLYIGDTSNHRIRTLSPSGIVNTIAGTGAAGFSGDAGPAAAARLRLPRQVAIHSDGTIYFADRQNHRIRRIDSTGTITTVAGTGGTGSVFDGPATSVNIRSPWGVTVLPSGEPLFADTGRQRLRVINTVGQAVTRAGNGSAGFTGDGQATSQRLRNPWGVTSTSDGTVYFADYTNRRIRRVTTDGNLTTLAGTGVNGYTGDGGPASLATFRNPRDVAVDRAGNIYVADYSNHAIRKIDRGGMISTIAGGLGSGATGDGGTASLAKISRPGAVSISPDGSLYIGGDDDRIRKIENAVPAAVLSSDVTTGPAPLSVAFTGAGSTDDDGAIVGYSWDFGDGGTSTSVAPTHTYDAAGSYAVTLTVMDDSGAEVSASTTIMASAMQEVSPPPVTPSPARSRCHGQKPTIVGTNGHDVIVGTPGRDVIVAGAGDDLVRGLAGNDRICLGTGADRGIGGPGGDVIHGGTGPDLLVGGPGSDGLSGGKGRDALHGHAGGDTLIGGGQDDVLSGGVGRDLIRGGGGNDRAIGGPGPDRIFGGSSNDALFGNVGNDFLIGQDGRDSANGGRGDDTCRAETETNC